MASRLRSRELRLGRSFREMVLSVVASPLLKQRFDLESGRCLDDETVTVTTYEVRTHRDSEHTK